MPDNNRRLVEVAEAAFGKRWRRPLAEAMGEHHTQVMRWSSGDHEISDEKLAKAREVCRKRYDALIRALGKR